MSRQQSEATEGASYRRGMAFDEGPNAVPSESDSEPDLQPWRVQDFISYRLFKGQTEQWKVNVVHPDMPDSAVAKYMNWDAFSEYEKVVAMAFRDEQA